MWMAEYGVPFDLRLLPGKMFSAHLAILRGKIDKREKEQSKSEREMERAKRGANRTGK